MIWLRASSEKTGETYALESVLGTMAGDGGIAHGRLLVDFAEAVLGQDEAALDRARAALIEAAGAEAFVDAAAVAALFNAIDRVADATGTPLEAVKAEASAEFRAELGIDDFYSAAGKI